ncbi:sporulation protein [Cohnella sp. CFH 77786]|uniref:YtrH family sporulation protein n=1 Tax=Cohnella sp. CFH 77786 TaxID=2662265 RepID=UPI001C60B92C|nr:YtrH family sporulation protein [Cohnella sp. CFH 77786]MBW5447419.1 sporulation protein [Cohnella sp. CFH 77786]
MSEIYTRAVFCFFIAFGVVLGGALLAGMGAVFAWVPPKDEMLKVATHLKIWALVAAVGGTIDPIRVIETNMAQGHISLAIRQIGYILFAFLGAHMGTELIQWMCRSGR